MQLYRNNEGLGTVTTIYALNLDLGKYFGSELGVHVWCIILDCWHDWSVNLGMLLLLGE